MLTLAGRPSWIPKGKPAAAKDFPTFRFGLWLRIGLECREGAGAGWYADPSAEPGYLRYWDGAQWTDHRHRIPQHNSLTPADARRSDRGRRSRRRAAR